MTMPSFPKSFKSLQSSQPTQISSIEVESEKKKKFPSSFKSLQDKFEKEKQLIWDDSGDIEREQERGIAQATSRVLETSLGTIGNVQQAIKGITGLQVGPQLPTTPELQEFSEKATKGYTKPQSEFEKKGGEVLQDIAALSMPGAASQSIARNIGIPIAGFLAKEGLEKIGASENSSNMAKIGLMFGLDLASAFRSKGYGGAKGYAQKLWAEAEENIPMGAKISSKSLEENLNKLESSLKSGGSSPKTDKALEKIKELKEKISNGEVSVKELVDTRKRINDWIDANGGFDFFTNPKTKKGSIDNLNQVKNVLIETLDDYAKVNPKFGIPYQQSNEAYSVYHSSNAVSNWLKKNFGSYLHLPGLSKLFGIAAKGTAAAIIPLQVGKLLYRTLNSAVLSELYGNVIKAAVTNDTAAAAQNLSKLNQELKKEDINQEANK